MACILNIETSTDVCSVAISQNGVCLLEKTDHSGPNHAVMLGVYIDQALSFIDSRAIPLDAVAVSCGPGSYTGLRIGVSMAKGICYGRNAKLIAIPTLELLCVPILLNAPLLESFTTQPTTTPSRVSGDSIAAPPLSPFLCPMLDARRMEVYAQLFDRSLSPVRDIRADIVDADTYRSYLDDRPVLFFGNGAAKCMDVINHPNAHLVKDIEPLARNMLPLAEKRFLNQQFEDVAYFVPYYLKDFVAKPSKPLL